MKRPGEYALEMRSYCFQRSHIPEGGSYVPCLDCREEVVKQAMTAAASAARAEAIEVAADFIESRVASMSGKQRKRIASELRALAPHPDKPGTGEE